MSFNKPFSTSNKLVAFRMIRIIRPSYPSNNLESKIVLIIFLISSTFSYFNAARPSLETLNNPKFCALLNAWTILIISSTAVPGPISLIISLIRWSSSYSSVIGSTYLLTAGFNNCIVNSESTNSSSTLTKISTAVSSFNNASISTVKFLVSTESSFASSPTRSIKFWIVWISPIFNCSFSYTSFQLTLSRIDLRFSVPYSV